MLVNAAQSMTEFMNHYPFVFAVVGIVAQPAIIHGGLIRRKIAADQAIVPNCRPRTGVGLEGNPYLGILVVYEIDAHVGVVLPHLRLLFYLATLKIISIEEAAAQIVPVRPLLLVDDRHPIDMHRIDSAQGSELNDSLDVLAEVGFLREGFQG